MGLLVEGQWVDQQYVTDNQIQIPANTQFRNWITRDGSSGFKSQANRYHLYISLACPWAHRVYIMRKLKGLQAQISLTIVSPLMLENGWTFTQESPDPLGNQHLHQVYTSALPNYTGRVTVPVLWDKQRRTIVSNQSSELILMLNSEFDCENNQIDYYPIELKEEIDEINAIVFQQVNIGVYRAGFATSQEVYTEKVILLFKALDEFQERLGNKRYLCGQKFTVADIRLFTTLVRFDSVYFFHFKCNLKRIEDYSNLSGYLRDVYQYKDIYQTVNFQEIKTAYFRSHNGINPTGIIPAGPLIDYTAPHDRTRLS